MCCRAPLLWYSWALAVNAISYNELGGRKDKLVMSRISDLENLLQGQGRRLDALEAALADARPNSSTIHFGSRLDEQEARIRHLEDLLQASDHDPAARTAKAARRVSPVALRAISNLNSVPPPSRAQAVSNLVSVSPPRHGARARPLHEEVLQRQALEANSLQGVVEEQDDEPWKGKKPIPVPKPAAFTAWGRKSPDIVNLDETETDEWWTGEGNGTELALDEEAEGSDGETPKKPGHPAKARVTKPKARRKSSATPTSKLSSDLEGEGDGVTMLMRDEETEGTKLTRDEETPKEAEGTKLTGDEEAPKKSGHPAKARVTKPKARRKSSTAPPSKPSSDLEGERDGVTVLTQDEEMPRDEEVPKKSGHPAKARATKSKAASTLVQTDLLEPAADATDAHGSPKHSRKVRAARRRARRQLSPQGGPRLRRGRVPSMLVHTDPLEPAADPTDTYDEAEAARAADHEEVDEGDEEEEEEEEEEEDELAGDSAYDA